MQLAVDRFGPLAGDIISVLCKCGNMRITDIIKSVQSDSASVSRKPTKQIPGSSSKRDMNAGHASQDSRTPIQDAIKMLGRLLDFGLLTVTRKYTFRSDADFEADIDKLVPDVETFKGKSKKEKLGARAEIANKMRDEWEDGTVRERRALENFKIKCKRPLEDWEESQSRKRVRIDEEGGSKAVDRPSGVDILDLLGFKASDRETPLKPNLTHQRTI